MAVIANFEYLQRSPRKGYKYIGPKGVNYSLYCSIVRLFTIIFDSYSKLPNGNGKLDEMSEVGLVPPKFCVWNFT